MMVIMMMMILFKFDIESFKTIFKNTFFYKTSPAAAFKTRHQKTREMPEQQKSSTDTRHTACQEKDSTNGVL